MPVKIKPEQLKKLLLKNFKDRKKVTKKEIYDAVIREFGVIHLPALKARLRMMEALGYVEELEAGKVYIIKVKKIDKKT